MTTDRSETAGARTLAALSAWLKARNTLGPDHCATRYAKQALDAAQAELDKRHAQRAARTTTGVEGGADDDRGSEW